MAVGRLGRAHGMGGEVRMDPMGAMPRGLKGYTSLYLSRAADPSQVETVELDGWRRHGQWLLLMVRGVRGRDNAAALTGRTLYVPRDEMPGLKEGEFYYADLLGAEVLSKDGESLGRVEDIKDWGEYDMLIVSTGKKHWMVPVLERYVEELDVEAGRVVVDLPEGLGP